MSQNKKNITLRLNDETYEALSDLAVSQNRSIANLVETLMIETLKEASFVDDYEMQEILTNKSLLRDLKAGSKAAKAKKGKFV